MATATVIEPDSDADATSSAKQTTAKTKGEPEVEADGASEEENGEDEGSEYEIEAIIDAKRGKFPGGRIGYLVKWKGYGDSENSWVDEADAENAGDLVAEYWKKHPHKNRPRKSTEPKRSRKSTAIEDSDVESASTKKRGRKSTAKASLDAENEKEDDRVSKKSRKGTTAPISKKSQEADVEMASPEEPEVVFEDMSHYMNLPNWEDLVATVDTVEREQEKFLTVFFTLKTGERAKVPSPLCAERFPRKLIAFYEENLRWRTAEEIES